MWNIRWVKKETDIVSNVDLVTPAIPGIVAIVTIDDLLLRHQAELAQLNELAGLSERNFKRYYLCAIQNFARFVQRLPASEVHHHAGLGGMLAHTLEVCVIALKLRRSYLLSEGGSAEEISATHDLWTFALFSAALCHDLAKVAVDQTVTVYDHAHHAKTWSPWQSGLDEQGLWYTTQFNPSRQYHLHEKASLVLIHRILPDYAMHWLASNQKIFTHWLASLCGDRDNASALGEIVTIADGKSVARNLGADSEQFPTVRTIPLHEKMLTALRYLLTEGELPLNRNGAAGWVLGDDCWLVSKRTVDAIRDQLTKEGHSGVPTKNGRLFDILQERGILLPFEDKAIWTATVEGNHWRNELTLIRIPVARIWANQNRRPEEFKGRVVVSGREPAEPSLEVTATEDSLHSSLELTSTDHQTPCEGIFTQPQGECNSPQSPTLQEGLPTFDKTSNNVNETAAINFPLNTFPSTVRQEKKPSSTPPIKTTLGYLDPADRFFKWLRAGIQSGEIKTNRPKARVHVVKDGVGLITPGIFQDYAQAENKESSEWTVIQKKVLKRNWHVKDEKGLNVISFHVEGGNKSSTLNMILFQDTSLVFGDKKLPGVNPHLRKNDDSSKFLL